jgi:hypothetical protein
MTWITMAMMNIATECKYYYILNDYKINRKTT